MNQKETKKPCGLIIAELIDKNTYHDKNKETFYLLNISGRRTLTEMVLTLRGEENPVSLPTDKLFAFPNTNKNRFAYTLEKGYLYAFWFTKTPKNETQKDDYFQVQDWRKLAPDKRYIERTLRLVLNQKEAEEEVITNKELLLELKRRIKEKSISFQISAIKGQDKMPELDTDLKDEASSFRINLQEDEEE